MSNIGKIIRVNALPPAGEREINVIYQVAAPGAATYTDYAIDANGDLKTHAVVDGSIPVELSDDHVSISDLDLLAEGIATQADYNTDARQKIDRKLDKPLIDGNVQDYNKIVGLNTNGEVAKLPAGDLGKNVANSALTSVAGAGLTLGADWVMNTSGKTYTISGLSDVSNDSTFNTFLSQNTNGKIGKTNGKQPFLSLPTTLSDSERTAWKTAMNGGWTTNTMSVAIITPSIIAKADKITWVSLKGANLNLNPASFAVDIMANDGTTLIANIPGSQVQLNSSIDLTLYYNFKNLPIGNYRIRLWNGVAYYITQLTIQIVNTPQSIDINAITWTGKAYTTGQESIIFNANGANALYTGNSNNKAFANEPGFIVAGLKSSLLFPANSNFYLKFSINTNHPVGVDGTKIFNVWAGLMLNSIPIDIINSNLIQAYKTNGGHSNYNATMYFADSNSTPISYSPANTIGSVVDCIITRNGGELTITVSWSDQIRTVTKNSTTEAVSLALFASNSVVASNASISISEAYTF